MTYRLILVSANHQLSDNHCDAATSQTAPDAQWTWIDDSKAAQCEITAPLSISDIQALRAQFIKDQVDVFCVPTGNTDYRLFLADMDSTIVTTETLDEMAAKAGIKDQIETITKRAMNGELDFEAALKERVGLLTGLSDAALQETLNETDISGGAHSLLTALQGNNIKTVLVSGGFTFFTGAIAQKLGFDHHHGNVLHVSNGVLDGTVGDPILTKDSKLAYLNQYSQDLDITPQQTIAIGDGANDLPMLQAAGLGIGYHPKPVVQEQILNCICHNDLSAVLYML